MRKFTLFLALMVTMVTSAFAQTVVSNLADFKSDKCYTVTTETRGGWAVKSDGSQFCSTNDAGLGTTSDATDANQQFAVLTVNGEDYFLYSVGAKKFVKSDRSLNANSGDAIEFADAGDNRVRVNFKGINNSFINLGGGNQMTVDWWSNMDAGNKVQFLEVADFDATEALAALNSAVEVVYVYMYNGVEVSREVAKSEIGNAYPALANVPFGFTANTPEGVIEAAGEVVVECALVENYPIKYAATAEEIDTWYYMQMHSNNKKYIQYLADQAYLEWADAEVAEGEEDSYTWAFVGDPANGFKLVNYAAGKEMAVCSDGSSDPVLGAYAEAVVWKPAKSQATGNDGYFCLQFPGGNYMNAQNGKVAYWSSNDAGSTLLLTEREVASNVVMPTEYLSTNEYVPYQLPGIKLVFDEKVIAADLAEGETSYGYILNAAGEKVLELNKKGYISGNLKYVSFTNDNMDYVEGAGDYTVVITATITLESGNVCNGGEFVLTVTKKPAEITMDVDLWGTLDAMPTTINITVDNVEVVALDETKKATLTIDETVYEAVATLNGNVITLTFPEDVEYANGSYTFVVPEGFFTYDGEASQEIWESFTYRKAVPLKVLSITPAEGNVESIEKITIVFNQEINANWEFEMNGALFVRTDGWAASATIEYTASVYDQSIWDYAPSPATAPGEYVLNIEYVTEMALAEGEKATYTWTIKEAATESGIDTSKEYYLYSSYNWGMNKGYLAIGTKSGSNYGPAYMANEKLQAFKLTPAADGGYTLSREADMGGMKYTEYIDCTHAYNVGNNAMSGSVLHFELNTNNKYYIKSDNGYFKADMIDYGTDGYAYHVFSNGDMTSALEWELIPVEDVVEPEQPAVEPLNYVSHTPATAVESISEVTITFDREVGSVSSDLSNVKLKLDTSVPARGMSSAINGNSVTIYLSANVKKSGEYTLEIPADIIKAADGGVFAGTTLTIIVDAAPVMTSSANVNVDNTLSTITAEFDSEVEFAAESDVTVLNVYVQNTETVAATITVANNASIEGNVLTLTLDEAIAPEVTTKYTVEIPAGWIIKKGSDKAFAGKKLTYTVKIPFALKNITPASGSTVEVFENIVAEYNATVNFYPSATNFKLINVADNSEIALVATKDGNVVTFTTDAEVPNGTYKLANLNNVVDNSSFLAPAELPEYTITVDNTTAIEGVDAEAEQTIYDLTGRRITEITKGGIYIVNGKKVLVK